MSQTFTTQATKVHIADKLKHSMNEIRLFMAANMQTNRAMLFKKSGAYNGHKPWEPLKLRQGQPLKDRGTLSKSLGPEKVKEKPEIGKGRIVRISGNKVTIGTNLIYAWLMNWGTTKMPGGKMVSRTGKALKIPLPSGKRATGGAKDLSKGATGSGREKFIFRHSVKIPARRFDDWSRMDEKEMMTALGNKVKQVLNR